MSEWSANRSAPRNSIRDDPENHRETWFLGRPDIPYCDQLTVVAVRRELKFGPVLLKCCNQEEIANIKSCLTEEELAKCSFSYLTWPHAGWPK